MNITVIGCGETGATISALLLSRFEKITLNILDPDEGISGKILDLEHAATCNGSKILWNDFESASDSDCLFFTAGMRGEKGEDRSKKAKENKELIASIFSQFEPKTNALIITISNPTEVMACWIFDYLKGRNIVVGTGTGLDTYRLQNIIAKHFERSIHDINTLVLGEHGSNMTPVWSQTTISGDYISEKVSDEKLNDFTVELKNSATQIRKTEVATKFGVSQCAVAILNSYISPNKAKLVVSFPATKVDQIESDDIFISWPCMIGNASISAVQNIKMDKSEMAQLKEGIEAIKGTTNL
jgi:L-lactate dehydrogenase